MSGLSPFMPAPTDDPALQQVAAVIAASPQLSAMVEAIMSEGMPIEAAIAQVAQLANLPLPARPSQVAPFGEA